MLTTPVFKYAALPGYEAVVDASEKKWGSSLADNAGLDLYGALPAAVFTAFPATVRVLFRTGIAVAPPPGVHIMVAGRSGLSFKNVAVPFYGIVDSSYRGEVRVALDINVFVLDEEFNKEAHPDLVREVLEDIFLPKDVKNVVSYPYEDDLGISVASKGFCIMEYLQPENTPIFNTYKRFFESQDEIVGVPKKLCCGEEVQILPTKTAVAQMVFLNYAGIDLTKMKFERVDVSDLPESSRGNAGFGSTG